MYDYIHKQLFLVHLPFTSAVLWLDRFVNFF